MTEAFVTYCRFRGWDRCSGTVAFGGVRFNADGSLPFAVVCQSSGMFGWGRGAQGEVAPFTALTFPS